MGFKNDMECDEIKCPNCGSYKISEITTYQCTIEKNVKTGKILRKDKIDNGAIDFWNYTCRECGWISECFSE